ncbi:hypothetical protein AYO41_01400 [Verrucomicrobia bacterium SCGC AG-212-E04]|nr:hypothetical protein AYO41_01400 [Verrucomicrobia bacterium SCGC AG-212-E04]
MKRLIRSFALVAILAAVLVSTPACYRMPADVAKVFYLEQMEKTASFQAQHAKHEEKKAEDKAEAKGEAAPTPQKLVPDGK